LSITSPTTHLEPRPSPAGFFFWVLSIPLRSLICQELFYGRLAVSIYFYIFLFTNRIHLTYIVRMISHHDPETRQILNARKVERDAEWCRKQIGDAAYLRSLMILGYGDKDAQTELNLLKLLRR